MGDKGGWTALVISQQSQFTIQNLGSMGVFSPGSRIDDPAIFDGGWHSFGYEGSIYVGDGSSLLMDNSLFHSNTTVSAGTTFQLYKGKILVSDSVFIDNTSTTFGGAAIYADGSQVSIENSTFYGNQAGSDGTQASGGAIYAQGGPNRDGSFLSIVGSYFQRNSVARVDGTGHGGAISTNNVRSVYIKGTTFDGNSSDYYGGAISSTYADELIIQDSSFANNISGVFGAGLTILNDSDSKNFIVAKDSDVVFSGNTLTREEGIL